MSTPKETSSSLVTDVPYVDKSIKEKDGHFGILTSKQEEALKAVREDPASEGYSDREVLRFLRSVQFKVPTAIERIAAHKVWYEHNNVGRLLESMPPKVDLMGRLVPHAHAGFDREGHPIYIERAGAIDPFILMSQFADNEILMSHVWSQERQIQRCNESSLARGLPEGSIERFTTIMDLKGMNMSHRACLKFTKKITDWDNRYYPDRLGYVIIVNPPGIFSFFWNIAKIWLDSVTKSRIIVCKNDFSALHELVDPAELPARYGGTLVNEDIDTALGDPDPAALSAEFNNSEHWESKLQNVDLTAGKKHVVNIPVTPSQRVTWYFKSNDQVGFQASFYPEGVDLSSPVDDNIVLVVTNWGKCDSHKIANQGLYNGGGGAGLPGTLVLVWDNDKWWGAKSLSFAYEVQDIAEEMAEGGSPGPASPANGLPPTHATAAAAAIAAENVAVAN